MIKHKYKVQTFIMTDTTEYLLLVAGYIRELMRSGPVPFDIISEINRFFHEYFPHLFAIKCSKYNFNAKLCVHGIEYIDMHMKVTKQLNILDVRTKVLIKDIRSWDTFRSGIAVAHNFEIPSNMRELLPLDTKFTPSNTTAIFKIGGSSFSDAMTGPSNVIIVDHTTFYQNKLHRNTKKIIHGYQLKLPPIASYCQLLFHSSGNTLFSFSNNSKYNDLILHGLAFDAENETNGKKDRSTVTSMKWNALAKETNMSVDDTSALCIPSTAKSAEEYLMFCAGKKSLLYPLRFSSTNISDFDCNGNGPWINVKKSNFHKTKCAMCFDSIRSCAYVGCGLWNASTDVFDFHRNKWYANDVPAFIDIYWERPRFWMQKQLLFVCDGSIENVKFVDLRDCKKEWKDWEHKWKRYPSNRSLNVRVV